MALSKEEKEALAEHYKNRDLYDPSKAKEQEVCAFKPQPIQMAGGGEVEGDDNGAIDIGQNIGAGLRNISISDVGNAIKSAATGPTNPFSQMAKGAQGLYGVGKGLITGKPAQIQTKIPIRDALASQSAPIADETASNPPLAASLAPKQAPIAQTPQISPQVAPQATPTGKLSPDQYDELIRYIKAGPGLGGAAMSGLSGLADAISTGVARTGNPGFQKQIEESRHNQKQNLIEALRGKYEAGYRGQELGLRGQEVGQTDKRITEEARHNLEGEKETRAARGLTATQQSIESERLRQQMSHQSAEEEAKNLELSQKGSGAINSLERLAGFGPPLPGQQNKSSGPVMVKTHAQYAALPKGTHYVDASGKQGVKK